MVGFVLIDVSESGCRFDPAASNHVGYLDEPGGTGGPLAFLLGPLLAIVALVLLGKAGRRDGTRPSWLPVLAAMAAIPLAALNFVGYVAKGAFACGFF